MSSLIVGLGNPGIKYHNTRHNIGWDVLDYLSFRDKLNWREKFKGLYASAEFNGEKTYFLKPLTYMNLSGESVKAAAQFFKIDIKNILVIHDELDLDFGTIAFKSGGGLAGHNGLKSIAQHMGGQDFLRLRMGIGRPVHGSVSNWVLSGYDSEQSQDIDDYLGGASKSIEIYINEGFQKASTLFSKKSLLNR